jgi:hypothetical protein
VLFGPKPYNEKAVSDNYEKTGMSSTEL